MTDDMKELGDIARELEAIEDELAVVEGMEQFRERISQIRMDVVEYGLQEFENS